MDLSPQPLAEAIRAQRKFPDHVEILYLFVLASYHVSESPLGHLGLRNLRDADSADPRVLLAEGLLQRKQGNTDEATTAFQQAARRGVRDAHLLLRILYRENGSDEAAIRELRTAEQFSPRHSQTALALGRMLLSQGKFAEARIRLEKALSGMPENPTVHYQLGLLYRKLNEPDKADHHLKKSRELAGK